MSVFRSMLLVFLLGAAPLVHALDILACEPEWAALAAAVAGPDANITSATGAKQDPHDVEARPALLSAVRRADMVACTGGGLEEGWLPLLLARGGNPAVQRAPGLFLASDHVALIDRPQVVTRAAGHQHARGNPHVHLDPRLLPGLAEALARQLGELHPDEADAFQARARQFGKKWEARVSEWEARAAPLRGESVVVHHRSWNYLARWLGLDIAGELEPRPGIPPSPAHLSSLREAVQGRQLLILRAPFEDARPSKWLAANTASCPLVLPFTVESQDEAGLEALFEQIIRALLENREQCSA